MFILMFQLDRMIFCGGRGGSRIWGGGGDALKLSLEIAQWRLWKQLMFGGKPRCCLPFFWRGGERRMIALGRRDGDKGDRADDCEDENENEDEDEDGDAIGVIRRGVFMLEMLLIRIHITTPPPLGTVILIPPTVTESSTISGHASQPIDTLNRLS